MSKTNAIYIIVGLTVAVAIFLGVAASNNSSSNQTSQANVVQGEGQCCPDDTEHHASKEKAWNEVCPVMGGKVQANTVTVEYNGKHYGFCCGGCDDQFAENPEKFAANLSEDGKQFIKE